MDKEVPATDTSIASETTGRGLPKSSAFPAPTLTAAASAAPPPNVAVAVVDQDDRGGVFRQLVKDDADIAGLVAYSIYKQNKLDWLTAFERMKSRAPNADELASYIIGEATPRRIATYRHLAEATLAGNGPEVGNAGGKPAERTSTRRSTGLTDARSLSPAIIGAYALLAALLVIGFIIAAHFTVSSR